MVEKLVNRVCSNCCSTQMLVLTPASLGADIIRFLAVMATMTRMPKPLLSGVWNVSKYRSIIYHNNGCLSM